MDNQTRITTLTVIGLFVLLAIGLFVYWPGQSGSFMLDDHPNLRDLGRHLNLSDRERLFEFVLSGLSGPTGRPLSLASFLINDYAWPSDPEPFKYTNVMLHLLNGALVLWLVWSLTGLMNKLDARRRSFVALTATGIWLLHPLNVSAVLYVIQRMTELSAFFTLAGLVCYVKGRLASVTRPAAGWTLMSVGIVVGGGLGVLCKENAVLLPVYAAVLEYTLLGTYGVSRPRHWRPWAAIFLATPIAGLVGWHVLNFERLSNGFAIRPFTLVERLLTEARVLWDYLGNILIPRRFGTGIFHDDFAISHSLFDPWTTLLAVGGLVAIVALAWMLRRREPLVTFAVFWFLGGHALEAGVLPLELYFEHRNYLPMIGPLLAVVYGLTRLPVTLRSVGYAAGLGLLVLSAVATWQNTTLWGNPAVMAEVWADEHPRSPRAQQFSADLWSRLGHYSKAKTRLERLLAANPRHSSAYVQLMQMDCLMDAPVDRRQYRRVLEGLSKGIADPAVHTTIAWLDRRVRENRCPELTYMDIDKLIATALQNPSFTERRAMAAHLYKVQADSLLARRNPAAAADALTNALKYVRNVDLALMKTSVLVAMHDYDAALRVVEKARAWDRSPLFGISRRQRDIDAWRAFIMEQKEREPHRGH